MKGGREEGKENHKIVNPTPVFGCRFGHIHTCAGLRRVGGPGRITNCFRKGEWREENHNIINPASVSRKGRKITK